MEDIIANAISRVLRKVRNKFELTQEEAAEKVGITVEHYARIERGQALPSLLLFAQIAIVMDVSADVLLDRGDEPFEPGGAPPEWFIPPEEGEYKEHSKRLRRLFKRLDKAPPEIVAAVEAILKQLERFVERMMTEQGEDEGEGEGEGEDA